MDTRQIRHFLAVVEHGNMLRAAEAIHLSQPALTRSIQNLESELDVPLFTRGPRGMTPTIYGNLLLEHARLLQNQDLQAMAEIRALKAGHAGHLRLGVANFAISPLPRVLSQLLITNPGLTVEIFEGGYEDLTDLVRQGAVDGLAAGFPPVHRAEDLVHEALIAAHFLIVCRAGHPLSSQHQIPLDVIAGQRWIIANRPRVIVELLEMMFRDAGTKPPRPIIESTSMTYLKAVLVEGDFVTCLPHGIVQRELESGDLVALPFAHTTMSAVEGIIYRAEAVHPPALFLLIEAIKAENASRAVAATPSPATSATREESRSGAQLRPKPARQRGVGPGSGSH